MPLRQHLRLHPNDVPATVRGIAEMNASMGSFPRADCPLPLHRQDTALGTLGRPRLKALFPDLDGHSLDELCDGFAAIRAGWPQLEAAFDSASWGLAHGDLASRNATVADGRLILLDLGSTGFGPLGSDLYWLMFRNRAEPEDQRQIVATYRQELARHDIAVTEEAIWLSAFTRYAQKWLFPSRRGTKASLEHLKDTQRITLEILRSEKWRIRQ